MTEDHWLDEAVRLAYDNATQGGRPFAALVMREQHLVASGVDRTLQDVDPTAHAELLAVRAACRELGTPKLEGCLLACSCEPCLLCQAAALLAGVSRCIYAVAAPEAASAGLDPAELARELTLPPAERHRLVLEHRALPFGRAPLDVWSRRAR